jgi:prepilin-type N-terminal cleavage/methylation domain-containing protein
MKKLIQKMAGRDGFTLMELVVTLVLLGILVSVSIPAYNGVAEETQGKRNEANMQTIREAFFHYFYRMHQTSGRSAHFPPAPTNETRVMDDEWSRTPMDSTRSPQAPKHLFSRSEVPKNANSNPFKYETWLDTVAATGEIRYYIKIEDIDQDSPSYEKSFTYSI